MTGEGFFIDKNEFLQNTAKSPFQKSLRDTNNYYFQHSNELEKYLDTKSSPQKTINRRLKIKNSYLAIFPMYGLTKSQDMF